MRSCIYCGKELEKGEKCNCPQAAARRNANNAQSSDKEKSSSKKTSSADHSTNTGATNNAYNSSYNSHDSTSYQTGYTRKDGRFKTAWQNVSARAKAKRREYQSSNGQTPMNKSFWKNLWQYFIRFIISPVDTISNPGYISKGTALVIAGIEGAIIQLCLYFLRTGAVRSPFGIVLSLITSNPIQSYTNLLHIGLSLLSGVISGILVFFIYSGIFYLINRFLLRQVTAFWDFAPRFALAAIPFALISLVGMLFGMFSSTTLAIMVITGIIGMIVLTYEALKTEWISFSSGRVLYSMMLGLFVFTSVICYIIRLQL